MADPGRLCAHVGALLSAAHAGEVFQSCRVSRACIGVPFSAGPHAQSSEVNKVRNKSCCLLIMMSLIADNIER